MSGAEHGEALSRFNTLRVESEADYASCAASLQELKEAVSRAIASDRQITILGGGSNVLLSPRISGHVIRMAITGIALLSDDGRQVRLRVGAGENWHAFVVWCHHQGFHGLANLALIPGTVGAAPIQNIGAYGVEVAPWIAAVHVLDRRTGECETLGADACGFAYRESVFKRPEGSHWIIHAVEFRLDREAEPSMHYPALAERLAQAEPSHDAVLASVMSIRQSRLPDPTIEPNVGSFFKNPIILEDDRDRLREKWPQMPTFPGPEGGHKIPAAWLIDQLGWRGVERDGVAVSERHALVLVGRGAVSAEAYLALADEIAESVRATFGIALEREPQVIGVSPAAEI